VSTRDRIVAAAAQLYGRYGYNGVGLKQVAAESGSPIGSLYHFFPGGQLLVEGILETAPDLESAIRISFAGAAEVLAASDYADACWIETVALEVASTNEPLRQVTAGIFDGWIEAATGWMERHGVPPDQARALGIAYITGLEGAFVLSRTLRSREPLHAAGEMLVAAAREVLASSATKGARR
jgi:AcrR family transcriptional regulator